MHHWGCVSVGLAGAFDSHGRGTIVIVSFVWCFVLTPNLLCVRRHMRTQLNPIVPGVAGCNCHAA